LRPSTGWIERRPGVRVGWAPQRPAHYGRLSPRENLELFARLENVDDAAAAADALVRSLELPDENRESSALSTGTRQRLNLALALLGDPRVLVLDEPTAALDAQGRRHLWMTARNLKERGGAVIFATHDHDDLAGVADRVVELSDGEVVFAGLLEEYARTRNGTVRA
ncbi:MAG: ATP-binding cassette domain-containing protein, partial [Actinomycetota bacterium]|nr:ATP-binding cassette domain-containing protein [Actinomycetota bacterium]